MYTSFLVWNPAGVDDALMNRLRSQFSDEQIVELGYFVSLTFGQQRWIKTLGIAHGQVTVPSVTDPGAANAGLAPSEVKQ